MYIYQGWGGTSLGWESQPWQRGELTLLLLLLTCGWEKDMQSNVLDQGRPTGAQCQKEASDL